ncbi:MAG: DinB family protein [Emticicia sp.]|nr:DinB family protein [Emticicia sp.]
MQSEKLIQSLIEQTRQIINQVEKLKDYDLHTLTWKANPTSWSILECLEHLNLYGNFYLPKIEDKIKNSKTKSETNFNNGLLGGYFAKSMLPKDKLNKMKAFKDKNPLNSKLDKNVIKKFSTQQVELLNLLNKSRTVSLNKVKIPTSISSLIRLKLGDTFRFYINHILRHLNQIDRIQAEMKNASS